MKTVYLGVSLILAYLSRSQRIRHIKIWRFVCLFPYSIEDISKRGTVWKIYCY